jgi:hypothetical protein
MSDKIPRTLDNPGFVCKNEPKRSLLISTWQRGTTMAQRRPISEEADDILEVLRHEGFKETVPPLAAAELYGRFGLAMPPRTLAEWLSLRGIARRLTVNGVTAEQVYNKLGEKANA